MTPFKMTHNEYREFMSEFQIWMNYVKDWMNDVKLKNGVLFPYAILGRRIQLQIQPVIGGQLPAKVYAHPLGSQKIQNF